MGKRLDLEKTIFELCKDDPDILAIMVESGFTEIAKPLMLNTIGKLMTIPKGAVMRGILIEDVLSLFKEKGYEVVSGEEGQK